MDADFDILIIENEPVIIEAAKKILKGFKVDAALDSKSGLQRLQRNTYKLVISDLMLPRVSGIDLIQKVSHSHPTLPIIIITGYAMLENALKCFQVGAFDFIPKPFDVEELLGVVHRAIRHGELIREVHYTDHDRSVKMNPMQVDSTESYYLLGNHSWARLDHDGVATFGIGETFFQRMGALGNIELPAVNSQVYQGNLCVRIVAQDQLLHTVWAPLSGKVIEVNLELEQHPDLINSDPFGQGWLIKLIPTNLEREVQNLKMLPAPGSVDSEMA